MSNELVKATTEEYKEQLLVILARIHEVCVEYGIRYTVTGGTLIGAIRHKGFIPWDDDIDIMLPREDYELFLKHFPSEDGRFYILNDENSEFYYNNFARACDRKMILKIKNNYDIENLGAFVDVFPIDVWPESKEERARYENEIRNAYDNVIYALPNRVLKTLNSKRRLKFYLSIWKRINNRCIVGLKKRKYERRSILLKYSNQKTGWRSVAFERCTMWRWYIREEEMDKRILVQFEDMKIFAPECYNEFLTDVYGDYMKLPPKEQRVSHHSFTPYWRND